MPQLHRQNTFQHLIKNRLLFLIYKQRREENTIKKYQQYLKLGKSGPLHIRKIRENFIKVLKAVNLDWRIYGLHSLRSGGASFATYSGVSDRLSKRHWRWKSDKAKDGYIEDSLESLLSVSKNLTWYSSITATLRYTRTRLF